MRDKKAVLEGMLAKGDVMICVDSRRTDVRVPDEHRGNPDLRLILNLGFRGTIRILPDGIEAELLFQGVPFPCWVPFESIWGVYDPRTGKGLVWPGQVPDRLRNLLERDLGGQVPGDERQDGPSAPGEDGVGDRPGGRARLRVIRGGKKG